jgi:hypothetical protein
VVEGSHDEKLAAFRRVRDDLRLRFKNLLASHLSKEPRVSGLPDWSATHKLFANTHHERLFDSVRSQSALVSPCRQDRLAATMVLSTSYFKTRCNALNLR